MNKDTLRETIERKITEAFMRSPIVPIKNTPKPKNKLDVDTLSPLNRASGKNKNRGKFQTDSPKRKKDLLGREAPSGMRTGGVLTQDLHSRVRQQKKDTVDSALKGGLGDTRGLSTGWGSGENPRMLSRGAAKRREKALASQEKPEPKPESGFMKGLKRVIGTKDDFKFGKRQGYVGRMAQIKARRDADTVGVANPDYDPEDTESKEPERITGTAAWNVVKRKQADARIQRGNPTISDLWQMNKGITSPRKRDSKGNLERDKFSRDYKARQGEELPGYKDGEGSSTTYGDAVKDLSPIRGLAQRAQAKRLAGDEGAIRGYRARATAKQTLAADKLEKEKEAMTPDERQSYEAEQEAKLYKEKEARKQAGIKRGADSESGEKDYPYKVDGVPWHKLFRDKTKKKELPNVINPAPEFEKPSKDPKKKKGQGPNTGKGSKSGASQKTPKGGRTGVRGAAGGDTRDVQARGIGASTELAGPRLSEMMQKRLKRNV